jgi:DNA-binding winged helix-turn-helix (wHTH) protein
MPGMDIDRYHFCFEDNSLVFENTRQPVQPKVMKLVRLLVVARGAIVSREKIEATLWPGAVVGLDSVNNTVARLRRLLGDNPRNPKYIETIPRIGYRLIQTGNIEDPGSTRLPLKLNKQTVLKLVSVLGIFALTIGFLGNDYRIVPVDTQVLHHDPEMQKEMMAKNMSVNELMKDFNIILQAKSDL